MSNSKSTAYASDVLALALNGVDIPGVASSLGSYVSVALHTDDPGAGGTQANNEAGYTGYYRLNVAKNPGSPRWTIVDGVANPVAPLDFPVCTGGVMTPLTHFSIGVYGGGATEILYRGPIDPPIDLVVGIAPRLTTASTISED